MDVAVERFEPVYLVPEGPAKLTEYGKRFFSKRQEGIDRFWSTILDVLVESHKLRRDWSKVERKLRDEGVPTAISSGLSAYNMTNILQGTTLKAAFTTPSVVAIALGTAAPTVSTTGASWGTAESTNYGGYARLAFVTPASNVSAVSGTNPATITYSNAGAVTFPNCSSGSATEAGFLIVDSTTIGAGNALWYGTLASVTISTTQTPPTIAQNALSFSLNGT